MSTICEIVVTISYEEGIEKDPIIFISLLDASSEAARQIFNLTLEGNGRAGNVHHHLRIPLFLSQAAFQKLADGAYLDGDGLQRPEFQDDLQGNCNVGWPCWPASVGDWRGGVRGSRVVPESTGRDNAVRLEPLPEPVPRLLYVS